MDQNLVASDSPEPKNLGSAMREIFYAFCAVVSAVLGACGLACSIWLDDFVPYPQLYAIVAVFFCAGAISAAFTATRYRLAYVASFVDFLVVVSYVMMLAGVKPLVAFMY